jgi:hypothetical protein
MKPTEHTRNLIHEAAVNAVPDVHLWPAIREQLKPRRVKPAHKGMLSMAAALLVVIVCAAVLLLQVSGDKEPKSKIPQAHLQDITQTAAEQSMTATPQQMTVEAPDASMPDLEFTFIAPDNFVDDAFEQAGELTWQQPREDFALERFPGEAIVEANGWAVVQAIGGYYVPRLEVGAADDSSQTPSYRSDEGAILFNLVDNENPPTDSMWYNSSLPYNFIVDGNITNLLGNYTLRVWPVTDPIDLDTGMQTLGLSRNEALAVRFTPQQFNSLVIEVENSPYDPAPDIAVLMPGGQTLTVFNPNETSYLSLNFLDTVEAGDQYLLFVAQDLCQQNMDVDQCENRRERQDITLRVQVGPYTGPVSRLTSTPQPIILSPGMVAVALPIPSDHPAFSMASGLLPGDQVTLALWMEQRTNRVVIENVEVVNGSYDANQQLILTVAVTPEDAETLTRAVNLTMPFTLEMATTETAEPTPLAGTIVLPPQAVAISLPPGSYVVPNGDAESLIGQYVDVSYTNIDTDGMVRTYPLVEGALVVSIGPYLSQFSNAIPNLTWATGEEVWGAITLAVAPEEDSVSMLNWGKDSEIPLRIMPAATEHRPEVTIMADYSQLVEAGLNDGSMVDLVLSSVASIQTDGDGPIMANLIQEEDDSTTLPLVLHDVEIVSGIERWSTQSDLPDIIEIRVRAIPQTARIIEWAAEQNWGFAVLPPNE